MVSSARRAVAALRSAPWIREHALVSAVFVITRAALHLAEIRFNLILNWMFLCDPADLRDRLFEAIYYGHAYPPGMNLLTGLLLKLGDSEVARVAHASFQLCGLVLANSLFYLLRASGTSVATAFAVSAAFTLVPPSIYFEHLYLWTYPVAALLCLAASLFHRAVSRPSFWPWFAFFLVCAALGWIRSTFHLAWFGGMVGLGVWVSDAPGRRRVLAAAAGPALLLLALYLKNLAVFGVFGASTSAPANLTTMTVKRLPDDVRDAWVREGKLSHFASVSVYAGPRQYLPYFQTIENPKWPPMLNMLERPSLASPNFNHWFFLEVNPRRRADALHCLWARPGDYVATALENLKRLFQPSTEWHPRDKTPASPHHQNRQVLGRYEALYNGVIHGFPVAPVGLYLLLPLAYAWALGRAKELVRSRDDPGKSPAGDAAASPAGDPDTTARGWLLYFCLVQIGFVVAASTLFSFAETSRYRYEVESLIWLVATLFVASLSGRIRARIHREAAAGAS